MSPPCDVRGVGARAIDGALELSVFGSFTRIGYLARRRLFAWSDLRPDALDGRVVVVTGASSGLGLAGATGAARLGANVVLVGRDQARTETAATAVRRVAPGAEVWTALADFARLDDVERLAGRLTSDLDHVDVLVHNAGALTHSFERTDDGLEVTAQTHVVAPFLLTTSMLPLLERATQAQVITVASGGMYTARLDVDALASPDPARFNGARAYALAKRAQVVLSHEWHERTPASVSFDAMHPGWADTPGLRSALPRFARTLAPVLRRPEEGADTVLWLAAGDRAPGGGRFWLDRRPRGTHYLPGTREPAGEADRLWNWCVRRAQLDVPTRS
jgi:NAD(P)-dependent dehydrogenase (short-subunit alcohol dehydrogenase family)